MAITKKWAANGIKTPIPNDPQGNNLVNYDEGFTTPYKTPIKDGGVPIGMGTFNQLMFDITDEVIENKKTLNQVAQQLNGIIDDTQTNLTNTWSSQNINNKINTAVAGVINDNQTNLTNTWSSQLINTKLSTAVAGIIDDNQITSTLTWSSIKIQAEIGQGGGGDASIDDNTISTDKVWSSFKTNQMVKGGRTISVNNLETAEGSGDTTITNNTANAKMVNLSAKVKTNSTANKYLGDIVVYYNDPSKEILRQSCVSQNITGVTNLTTAMGMTILDAQDSLIIKSVPASGVQDFWNNVKFIKSTSNVTGSAPEPEPLGEGVIFTAQASSSSVTLNKKGTPTELQLEYQTTLSDVTSGWQDYTLGTTIDLSPNDKVSFRNKGTQTITQTTANYYYFTMTGEIKAENDLTFLFDGVGGVDTIAEYGCYKMFSNCSALTEMPDLNATNIGANGYANMFEGCTKLKTIKPLNATTITNYSYKEMFKNCSGLIISEGSGENQFLSMPASAPSNAGDNMFVGTGGRFTGTPTASSNYFYNATIPATDMLRFTAQEASSSVTLNKVGSPTELQLEYRTNTNSTWQNYTLGTQINLANINDWVEMRNRGLQTLNNSNKNYHQFAMTGKIAASGNIQYLLDKTGELLSVANYCYNSMFNGCTSLTTAPSLPATTLANSCYNSMFRACTSLTTAPSLPATTLANSCYNSMFRACTSLTTAPSLPATTLANGCYQSMFYGCTSLTTAPSLPATTLADNCYLGMFQGCTSLTTAPKLPATTLAGQCYKLMFQGCTSLTTAPSLPATTLASNCYYGMFRGCTSLTTAPELPATTLANSCYEYMFEGCTSLTTAPSLPATTLANSCYSGMFYGCTSLTTAPSLPATTLANSCYEYMFEGCTSLTTAPSLPATTLADYCYYQMFNGCTSLTTAPSLPATTLADSCYQSMFYGCTSLTTAPSLPATTLADYCYKSMFKGCTKLKVNQNGSGTKIFTCPSTSGLTNPVTDMFAGTGGSFTGTPTTGKTYNWYN